MSVQGRGNENLSSQGSEDDTLSGQQKMKVSAQRKSKSDMSGHGEGVKCFGREKGRRICVVDKACLVDR